MLSIMRNFGRHFLRRRHVILFDERLVCHNCMKNINTMTHIKQIMPVRHLMVKYLKKTSLIDSFCNQIFVRYASVKVKDITGKKLNMNNPKLVRYLKHLENEVNCVETEIAKVEKYSHKLHLISKVKDYWRNESDMTELQKMIDESSSDKELLKMAAADLVRINKSLINLESEIIEILLSDEEADDDTSVILELSAGVGGQEAMLFTSDILNMYEGYAAYNGWEFEIIQYDLNEMGGIRKASATIKGPNVYKHLKYEGGVHRVQRIPKTERGGRIHTSTMAVAVLPQPTELHLYIDLKKDIKITTMKASGAGGQHVNTTDSAVRILHIPSGITVNCQTSRSQIKNRELAMQLLRSRLYEKETETIKQKTLTQRKLQVGSAGRSEKIRTYNFQQDRVTDHRIGQSIGNIKEFIDGGEELHKLIESILDVAKVENLFEMLEQFDSLNCSEVNVNNKSAKT